MNKFLIFLFFLHMSSVSHALFLEENPNLRQFIYEEPTPNIYIGFGLAPVGILNSKIMFSANLFQVHYIGPSWDIEIISASYGKAITQSPIAASNHFTLRHSTKFKVYKFISIGPMVGIEFVRFSNLTSMMYQSSSSLATPEETFTTNGLIYGIVGSQTFDYRSKYKFKISQLIYKQTYEVDKAPISGWEYLLKDANENELNTEELKADLQPDMVYMLEFSLLW